ncbi:helix-turn-helix domain-containing protein [Shewanella yunxiaonensis]|uniref:Helix-turn-helix domain-containing protein n=1 Tax=Shewanella yunxiaonensis TaxID=2829809 RepID=A0ABX7YVW0_9GAMM|nr:helix-turn-helix domain-containing protein [Shewanella yunxiaonensis]QUN06824.1 helix-turn-helix domain-containing protein [Shewanella yunxiaonensis]
MINSLLTPQQVAEMLGVTEGTLSVWRCTGRYPLRFVKVGRRVMYRQADIDAFIDGRVYEHTL